MLTGLYGFEKTSKMLNMKMRTKLVTIVGTRPEIIRLSEVLKMADKYFNHKLIHTGQNYDYELNGIFFKELGLRNPDYVLNCAGKDLGETMGNVIAKTYDILKKENPDAVLVLGDTNSALSAIAAKRLKLPIFHMEAGNRCWDWNVAEMTNRTIVDHISDVNLPYTENSRLYLMKEGIDPKRIFVTGSPMREVIEAHRKEIEAANAAEKLCLKNGEYIILSAHREENIDIDANLNELVGSINGIAEEYQVPVIYSLHPRSRKKLEARGIALHPLVKEMKPFGFFEYVNLEKHAKVVVSDSGTLTEEASIVGFPAVLLRTSTERPEGLDEGNIVVGGIKKTDVLRAVKLAIEMHRNGDDHYELHRNYENVDVSSKVVKIIQSYYHIIRKETWLQ